MCLSTFHSIPWSLCCCSVEVFWGVTCCILVSVNHFLLYLGFYPEGIICVCEYVREEFTAYNCIYLHEGPFYSGTFHLLLFQATFININKYRMIFSFLSPIHS